MKNDSFKTMIRFSLLSLGFCLLYIWTAYLFLQVSYKNIMLEQSLFMAKTVKQMHETQVKAIDLIEKQLNMEVRMKLFLIKDKVKEQGRTDVAFLNELKEKYKVTDVYIIDKHYKVISSTATKDIGLDVTSFYKDDKQLHEKWMRDLKYMLSRENGLRIDPFYQETLPPHKYRKWAYIGAGAIDGEPYIVEFSIALDDIFQQRLEAKMLPDYKAVIKDIKIVYESPFVDKKHKSSQIKKKDNTIETSVEVNTFNNTKGAIVVTTRYDEMLKEIELLTFVSIVSTLFIVFIFVVFSIYVRLRFSIFMFRRDN